MGYRKPIDYTSIHHQIYMAGVEIASNKNDGYTQLSLKQDLWRLKFLIDSIISSTPTFVGEEEFLKEHEHQLVVGVLKRDFQ